LHFKSSSDALKESRLGEGFPASNVGLTLGEIRPMKKKQVFQGISETYF
jgi:hypothetical protein